MIKIGVNASQRRFSLTNCFGNLHCGNTGRLTSWVINLICCSKRIHTEGFVRKRKGKKDKVENIKDS